MICSYRVISIQGLLSTWRANHINEWYHMYFTYIKAKISYIIPQYKISCPDISLWHTIRILSAHVVIIKIEVHMQVPSMPFEYNIYYAIFVVIIKMFYCTENDDYTRHMTIDYNW